MMVGFTVVLPTLRDYATLPLSKRRVRPTHLTFFEQRVPSVYRFQTAITAINGAKVSTLRLLYLTQ